MNRDRLAPDARGALRAALLGHYDRHRRSMPWRGETDPYRILVSEIMLQQTRVDTVMSYYETWLERFPTLSVLADAEMDEVLEAWEGLGYYRRARNLHRAAVVVRDQRNGRLPTDSAALRRLPGVGDYTAGAVASIAFGQPVPAVDGNVRRVLARLFDEPDPRPAELRDVAAELLDADRPGDWNQAVMELGATVCTPRNPGCDGCPVAPWCAARAEGTQLHRPAPTRKKAPRRTTFSLAVLRRPDGRVLLVRRPEQGLLAGMWAFPERQVSGGGAAAAGAARDLAVGLGEEVRGDPAPLPECKHAFTHVHATYLPFLADVSDPAPPARSRGGGPARDADDPSEPDRAWVDPAAASDRAIPVAQRRILASLADAPPVPGPTRDAGAVAASGGGA